MNARLWMGFGLGRIARYQVHRVTIVEMRRKSNRASKL